MDLPSYLLTSSMNWSPTLADSVSADLTKSINPGRHPLPTSETKCSRIRFGFPSPSVWATQRFPSTYATSFLMSNGAVERSRNSSSTASLLYINCLCSTEPAAILDSTHAASYINYKVSTEDGWLKVKSYQQLREIDIPSSKPGVHSSNFLQGLLWHYLKIWSNKLNKEFQIKTCSEDYRFHLSNQKTWFTNL